mgnify:CR=1 FL=1
MIYINKIINRRPMEDRREYPYNIPAILHLNEFEFKSNVTFIIGENGSGKSTFIEAIAVSVGLNPEGGSSYLNYHTYDTHSSLFNDLKLTRGPYRNKDSFFLRAESFYNVASELDRITDSWNDEELRWTHPRKVTRRRIFERHPQSLVRKRSLHLRRARIGALHQQPLHPNGKDARIGKEELPIHHCPPLSHPIGLSWCRPLPPHRQRVRANKIRRINALPPDQTIHPQSRTGVERIVRG